MSRLTRGSPGGRPVIMYARGPSFTQVRLHSRPITGIGSGPPSESHRSNGSSKSDSQVTSTHAFQATANA